MKDSGLDKQPAPKSKAIFWSKGNVNSQDDQFEALDKARKEKENKKKTYQRRQKRQEKQDGSSATTWLNIT